MTPKQEDALLDYLQEVITPLIERVLVKKLGQAMSFAKEELIQRKREWQGLTEEEIQECLKSLPTQTIDIYARRIEAKLKEKNNG